MNKFKTVLLLSISLNILGCSSSTELASKEPNMEPYPQKKSSVWCQKNYYSASVSTKERQSRAKHCDTQARQAYVEAKENNKPKEK